MLTVCTLSLISVFNGSIDSSTEAQCAGFVQLFFGSSSSQTRFLAASCNAKPIYGSFICTTKIGGNVYYNVVKISIFFDLALSVETLVKICVSAGGLNCGQVRPKLGYPINGLKSERVDPLKQMKRGNACQSDSWCKNVKYDFCRF